MLRRGLFLLFALSALAPCTHARAYTVLAPGELLRMNALIVWDAGEEVLLLSPVVRGGGVLLLPLPPDARLLSAPPEAAGWLGLEHRPNTAPGKPPQEPDEKALEGSAGGAALPRAAATSGLAAASRARLRHDAPGAPSSLGGTEPAIEVAHKILLVPADRLGAALERMGLSAARVSSIVLAPPEVEDTMAARILLVALPRDAVAVRVAPIAIAFASVWPRLPLLRAPSPKPHLLRLETLLPGPIRDLGGMEFTFGLRKDRASAVGNTAPSPTLLAFVTRTLARTPVGLRRSHLVAGAFDPRKAAAAGLHDLRLPPPPGARPGPPPRTGRASSSTRAPAPPAGVAAQEQTRPEGCEGCVTATANAPGRRPFALAALVLMTALACRRTPAPRG